MLVGWFSDRRLQENSGGVGDFQMTRAMAIVLFVAGSLVVVACGAATFLRYRRDDDGDDNDEDDRENGRGPDRTMVDAGMVCIAGSGNKPEGLLPHGQPANSDCCAVPLNSAMPNNNNVGANFSNGNTNNGGKNMVIDDNGKEYHCGNAVGGRVVGGLQRICSNTIGRGGVVPMGTSCADSDGSQDVVSGAPIALVPSSRSSPTTLLRGAPSSNNNVQQSYGTTFKSSLQQKMPLSAASTDQPGPGRGPQSYHSRNPDIIPAPLISPGTIYNNYNNGKEIFNWSHYNQLPSRFSGYVFT